MEAADPAAALVQLAPAQVAARRMGAAEAAPEGSGMTRQERARERLDDFCELRDSGVKFVDAVRLMEISEATGRRYERWWKESRGVPNRPSMMTGMDR